MRVCASKRVCGRAGVHVGVCVCVCMCVCVCVRVSVTQELASRERFIIASILCGRMSNEQKHDSTDPFAIVRMYKLACVYTCVHMCVSLPSKDMVRLIRSSWGVRRFVQGKKARARACVYVCVRVSHKQ